MSCKLEYNRIPVCCRVGSDHGSFDHSAAIGNRLAALALPAIGVHWFVADSPTTNFLAEILLPIAAMTCFLILSTDDFSGRVG